MYPVSQAVINQFIAGGAEKVTLTITPTNSSAFTVSTGNLKSFKLDRYCCANHFEIGSAIASEIDFVLENTNGQYDSIRFEGAEVYATMSLGTTSIPLGYFTIDNSPRKLSTITLTALDRMVQLDKKANVTFPCSVAVLINTICTNCHVTLGTAVTSTYQVKEPTTEVTYRQLLQWACQILGCNAYFDWQGYLKIETYQTLPAITLDKSVRFKSDVYENANTITGVQYENNLAGTQGYVIDISSNEIIDDPTIISSIYNVIGGFTWYPFECTAKSFPFLYPMDAVYVTDNKGNTITSVLTNTTYILNKNNIYKAIGETTTEKGYATLNPLTSTEIKIIQQLSEETAEDVVDERTQMIIDMNNTIANSLGLYVIEVQTQSGTIFYYCDNTTLASSSIIYTFGSNGFAWTDDWNDGDPTWHYGFTRDGNAIVNILSAYKVTADQLSVTGAITFSDLDSSTQNTISTASTTASSANTKVSNLLYTGTTYIDGSKIMTGTVTANQINATNLHVSSANIDGTITADEVVVTNGSISEANNAMVMEYGGAGSGTVSIDSNGDIGITTADGEVNIRGIEVNISAVYPGTDINLTGDVNITGDLSITGTQSGSYSGTFDGDAELDHLICYDYGTKLPNPQTREEGSIFFLIT